MIKKQDYLDKLEQAVSSRECFQKEFLLLAETCVRSADKKVILRVQIDFIKKTIKDPKRGA